MVTYSVSAADHQAACMDLTTFAFPQLDLQSHAIGLADFHMGSRNQDLKRAWPAPYQCRQLPACSYTYIHIKWERETVGHLANISYIATSGPGAQICAGETCRHVS